MSYKLRQQFKHLSTTQPSNPVIMKVFW